MAGEEDSQPGYTSGTCKHERVFSEGLERKNQISTGKWKGVGLHKHQTRKDMNGVPAWPMG